MYRFKSVGSKVAGKQENEVWDEHLDKDYGEEFEKILLDSIDEALSCLGESPKKLIYFHLEQKFKITRQDIPQRVGDFSEALEQVFGLGAQHLEILIMKNLHAKISCKGKNEGSKGFVSDLTFNKYVEHMKLCYEDEGKIGELEVIVDAGEQQEQLT